MPIPLHLLILEDNPSDAELMLAQLRLAGFDPDWKRTQDEEEFLALLDPTLDLILADYNLPQFDGMHALEMLSARGLDLPFILVSGTIGEELAVEAMKRGADDYLLKDRLARLGPAVTRALEQHEERRKRRAVQSMLRQSEDRYRDLVQNSQDLICTHALDGRILSANPAAARMLGYELADAFKMKIQDLLTPETKDRFDAYMETILKEGRAAGFMHVQTADGERRIWEYNNSLRTEGVSEPIVRGMARDVTQRVRAEEALQQSEKRFRALIEKGRDNISLLAADGSLLWESPSTKSTMGYAPNQFVGRNMFELMHADDQGWTREQFAQLVQTPGKSQDGIFRLRHGDGAWRWIESTATNMLNEPAVRAIVINYRDITERVRAEQEIRRYNEQLATAGDIGRTLASSLALDEINQHLGKAVKRLIPDIATVFISRFDSERQLISAVYGLQDDERIDVTNLPVIPLSPPGQGTQSEVIRSGKPLIVQDLQKKLSGKPMVRVGSDGPDTQSAVYVPLVSKEQVVGVIQLQSYTPARFQETDVELLTLVGNTAAVAIRNAELFEATQNELNLRIQAEKALQIKNRDLANLNIFAIEMASTQDSPDLYPLIASKLKEITGAATSTFGVYDPQKKEIRVEHVEMDHNLVTDLMQALGGRKLTDAGFPVSEEARRLMIQKPVRIQLSLSEITFGVISPMVAKVMQTAQGIDRFIGIAYVVGEEVFGSSVLALRAGQPAPELDTLEAYANIVAVSLKRNQAEGKLRESEKRFSTFFQSSPAAIGITRLSDDRLVDVNQAWERMTGYTREEVLGHTSDRLHIWVDLTQRKRLIEKLREQNTKIQEEVLFHRKAGDVGTALVSKEIISLAGEEYLLVSSQDITERKAAQEALRRSEEKYQRLTENALDIIFRYEVTPEMKLTYINPAVIDITGYTPEECLADPNLMLTMVHPEDRPLMAQYVAERRLPDEALSMRWMGKDGSVHWMESRIVQIHDESGNLTAVEGITRDVTERFKAEEALRRREQELHTLIENTPDAITRFDREGRYQLINSKRAGYFGLPREAILGKTWRELLGPEEEEEALIADKAFRRVMEECVENTVEYETMTPSGKRWVQSRAVPELDEAGSFKSMLVVTRDITALKQAEEDIRLQLSRLNALRAIDTAIAGSMDIGLVFQVILDEVISQLNVDAADILLFAKENLTLNFAAGRGFRTEALQHTKLPLGEGYAGRVALSRQMTHVTGLRQRKTDFLRSPSISQEGFTDYFGLPLVAKGEVKGVLEIFQRSPAEPNDEWLDFLETLAEQAAIAIDNVQLFEDLQRSNFELAAAYDATIAGWSHAMDLRDKETEGHTLRVTELTVKLAKRLGIPPQEQRHIRRGALLHDIGKLGVPDSILLKPGKLTSEEWDLMKRHPAYARDMLSTIAYLRPAMDIPYYHHEKWDGTGYPQGLAGEQIPLTARLFAVVDVWDALTSDRPYRPAWTREKALAYIQDQSGKHFDPQVVEEFLRMLDEIPETNP